MKNYTIPFLGVTTFFFCSYGFIAQTDSTSASTKNLLNDFNAYKKEQNDQFRKYSRDQEDSLKLLYQDYLNYETEREQEILSFKNKNVDKVLYKKAMAQEQKNKLEETFVSSKNTAPVATELKEFEKRVPLLGTDKTEPLKDEKTEPLVLLPSRPSSTLIAMETEANRPVFYPLKKGSFKLTSGYSENRLHPVLGVNRPHYGQDLSSPTGNAIYATANGIAEIAKFSNSAGNWVMVNHKNGYKTSYMHLSSLNVKPGQSVKKGQLIGYVGTTGYSTGPHLHYEVRKNEVPLNPVKFLLVDQ
ncbi:MAG: M23 family metallopeptidase [bacterium]|nr:M23 family metallopeptidase [bacterium]